MSTPSGSYSIKLNQRSSVGLLFHEEVLLVGVCLFVVDVVVVFVDEYESHQPQPQLHDGQVDVVCIGQVWGCGIGQIRGICGSWHDRQGAHVADGKLYVV